MILATVLHGIGSNWEIALPYNFAVLAFAAYFVHVLVRREKYPGTLELLAAFCIFGTSLASIRSETSRTVFFEVSCRFALATVGWGLCARHSSSDSALNLAVGLALIACSWGDGGVYTAPGAVLRPRPLERLDHPIGLLPSLRMFLGKPSVGEDETVRIYQCSLRAKHHGGLPRVPDLSGAVAANPVEVLPAR